jgi:hypothetical protein
MFADDLVRLSPPLIQAVEDAILLGNVGDIAHILDLIGDLEDFPENLRYGLEALLYYRQYYGKGGLLEPCEEKERTNMMLMESSWGRELIEVIAHLPSLAQAQYA